MTLTCHLTLHELCTPLNPNSSHLSVSTQHFSRSSTVSGSLCGNRKESSFPDILLSLFSWSTSSFLLYSVIHLSEWFLRLDCKLFKIEVPICFNIQSYLVLAESLETIGVQFMFRGNVPNIIVLYQFIFSCHILKA